MAYFPFFINIEGRQALVVGGGTIAERRICALLEFGCRIFVVSPDLTDELKRLAEAGSIEWRKECYHTESLVPYRLKLLFVLAAATEAVNAEVVRDCKRLGIPVNNASRKEECDFYFPSLIKEDEMVIGVTSGGSDHKAVAALSKKIRELVRKTWQV